MKKLNLGCGNDIRKGFINLDLDNHKGVDIVHNIDKIPWPFSKGEIDLIYTSHLLEHVNDLVKTMKEVHRICKNKARIIIRVPHFSCGVSYRDPTHKRFMSYHTFDYFTERCFYKNFPKFKIIKRRLNFTREAFIFLNHIFNPIININPSIYERFFCWMLPCSEILFELEVVKDEE